MRHRPKRRIYPRGRPHMEQRLRTRTGEAFRAMMQYQIDRAEQCYQDARALFARTPTAGRRMLRMMHGVYHGLLVRIGRQPEQVFAGKVRVPYPTKVWTAARSLWR